MFSVKSIISGVTNGGQFQMHYTCTATRRVNLATLTTVFSFRVIHYALQRTAH